MCEHFCDVNARSDIYEKITSNRSSRIKRFTAETKKNNFLFIEAYQG